MRKLILAFGGVLAVVAAGCSADSSGQTAPPPVPTFTANTSNPATSQTSGLKPTAATPKPIDSQPGVPGADRCAKVEPAATEACHDYLGSALAARTAYYQDARDPQPAIASKAKQGLASWYTGQAYASIAQQVNGWDPNITVDVDVVSEVQVTGGAGAASAGVATLTTIESWVVATEGGPVQPVEQQQTHTVTLLHWRYGWGVSEIK